MANVYEVSACKNPAKADGEDQLRIKMLVFSV
jgi:hypothetical protein